MVKMKDIEDKAITEAKEIAAEAESVLSQMIGFVTPRWDKFEVTWKTWSYRKKIVAVVIFALVGITAYEFIPSPMRLLGRGWDTAASYVPSRAKITPVTQSDLSALKDDVINSSAAVFVSKADFAALQKQVEDLKSAQAAKITTGSLPAKKFRKVKITTEPAN